MDTRKTENSRTFQNEPGDKIRPEWLPLVRKALDECFQRNPVEFFSEDEFKDTLIMIQKFQEAVSHADKTGSVRIFLEQVYSTLQLSFTNSTCQTIMNCMIYEELKSQCEAENNPGQELSELVRSQAKRKGETSKDEPRLKMPTLMPLTKFLKLEKHRGEKDLTSKDKDDKNDSTSDTPIPALKNISNQVINGFASVNLKSSPASGNISVQPVMTKEVENAPTSFTEKNSPASKNSPPSKSTQPTRNDIPALKDVQIKLKPRKENKHVSEPEVLAIDEPKDVQVRMIPCGLCLKKFNSILNLQEHEKSGHKNEMTYQCSMCKKRFYKLPFLELHRKVKHEKSFSCEYCNITLKDTKELEDHLISEMHEEKRFSFFFG